MQKITILGAGLTGTLLALRLVQRGYSVDLYEKRPDPRQSVWEGGRSINLALSDRGWSGLQLVGLEAQVREMVVPMYGRMIHPLGAAPTPYRYSGREDEYINSISRPGLNRLLLDEADRFDALQVYFDTEVRTVDLDQHHLHLYHHPSQTSQNIHAEVLIGADGAGSMLRRMMQTRSSRLRFNYSQEYLDTGYKELTLHPGANGEFLIEKNALHIWPRKGFMMIALPNLNGSFTLTLFMPFAGRYGFEALQTSEQVQAFIAAQFPDVAPLLEHVGDEYFENPASPLGTIKCYPWMGSDHSILMGDAAHAIVPFYGQGMNCCFEDVVEFDQCVTTHEGDWSAIFQAFQADRKPDTDAIAALAQDNFYEMRDGTADPVFNRKRQIELAMEQEIDAYASKYSLVTFRSDIGYRQAMLIGRKQDELLMTFAKQHPNDTPIDYQALHTHIQQQTAALWPH